MPRRTFWATKKIRQPVTVKFRRSDGSIARFRATKIIQKPVRVSFNTRRKRRYW